MEMGRLEPFNDAYVLRLVAHSSRIENISVNTHSTKELFTNENVKGINGKLHDLFSIRNNQMVAGFLNTMYATKAPLSTKLILQTHKLLMQGSYDHRRYVENGERPGVFRKNDYVVGRYNMGAECWELESLITDLCETINTATCGGYRKAAAFHCYFEAIHPFADGNGRCGRWLMNYVLVMCGVAPVVIPIELRDTYYAALEAYDRDEDFNPMWELLRMCGEMI